jgi:hypothetical protein
VKKKINLFSKTKNFEWFVSRIESYYYLVAVYSKSNRLSISTSTVVVIDIVADPYVLASGQTELSTVETWPVLTGRLQVCFDCLFLRSQGQAPYGTKPACAKRATYPDLPPRSPSPRIPRRPGGLPTRAQRYCPDQLRTELLQALGSSPGLIQGPIL